METSNTFMSLEETQKSELRVMKELHAFCEKHDLKYSLAEGTLLGAIRHKGFIPWDNDIDIFMPCKDVEKLLEISKREAVGPDIQLFSHEDHQNFHYNIVRACDMRTVVTPSYLRVPIEGMGVWVDIYPVCGFNRALYIIQKPLVWFFIMLLNANLYNIPPQRKLRCIIQKIVLRFFPDKNHKYEKALGKIQNWCDYKRAKYVIQFAETHVQPKHAIKKTDIENPYLIEFEDTKLYSMQNPEKLLIADYGDYMKLPPEDKRQTHDICARWK